MLKMRFNFLFRGFSFFSTLDVFCLSGSGNEWPVSIVPRVLNWHQFYYADGEMDGGMERRMQGPQAFGNGPEVFW